MAHPELHLWMNGEHVGIWTASRAGVPILRYDDAWLRSPNMRPLSLSLPIPAGVPELRGQVVDDYFDNLLPEAQPIRERVRRRFGLASTDAAELLAAIGRDCVGAVQLLPPGMAPTGYDRIDSEPLTDSQVDTLLRNLTATPALGEDAGDPDAFRISIAGAQEKTALLRIGDAWHRPLGATPTTHILKLPLGLIGNIRADMQDSVDNEWLCAQLLAAWGWRWRAPRSPASAPAKCWRSSASTAAGCRATPGSRACRRKTSARPPARPRTANTKTTAAPACAPASTCCPRPNTPSTTSAASCWRNLPSGCWPPPTGTRRTSRWRSGAAGASA